MDFGFEFYVAITRMHACAHAHTHTHWCYTAVPLYLLGTIQVTSSSPSFGPHWIVAWSHEHIIIT